MKCVICGADFIGEDDDFRIEDQEPVCEKCIPEYFGWNDISPADYEIADYEIKAAVFVPYKDVLKILEELEE
jgi:hypothetical protein